MTPRKFLAPAACLLLLLSPAAAQRAVTDQFGGRQEGFVRVQNTVSFLVVGPTGDSEDGQKLRDRSRRVVYDMAARECDLLREALAKECRLESVNVSLNINSRNPNQPEGYAVNGSMAFQITLK
jgi:hypothetical protein